MPMKTCPKCSTQCGPRTLYCKKCGAPYEKTLIKFGHISKGANVAVTAPQQSVVVNNNITVTPSKIKFDPSIYADNYGTLNLDPDNLFDDLYGKADALTMIMSSLRTYNDTNGDVRIHNLVIGSPSAGKSELVNRIETMVGKDNIFRFNSESASKAGIENEILNYPTSLPSVLICEEIEKTHPDNLLWMLPALDTRKEIIKVTAREGMQRRTVPFICIATCNDLEKLDKMHSGSISSRFSNKVYVKDMDDETLGKILLDKLVKIPNYDIRWVQASIDLAKKMGDRSVRSCTAIMFCGREKLISGEYEQILKASGANCKKIG